MAAVMWVRQAIPADGLRQVVSGLMTAALSCEQIETMGREVPGALVMG